MRYRAWILWAATLLAAPLAACGGESGTTGSGGSTTSTTTGGAAICGDNTVDGDEVCDDGNTKAGDGCDDACKLEEGFACKGSPSICKTTCGDEIVAGAEECDDGSLVGDDGCSPTCTVEVGFDCNKESPSVCTSVCGDGKVVGDEGCDDGDTKAGDGCSKACAIEPGFTCGDAPSQCVTKCGDGIVAGAEACDDGNIKSKDGCDSACVVEPGFTCDGDPSVCDPTCGDGLAAGSETCDDGNAAAGDGCSATCALEGGFICTGAPSACTPICGDSKVVGVEGCDDGNVKSGDGCASACTTEPGYACVGAPSVCDTVCGDGVVTAPETCDDGNATSGDGCTATCVIQMGYQCNGAPSACIPICGDGQKTGIEGCDDGNIKSNDGCSTACAVEAGFICLGLPSVCTTTCEDGIRAGAEACDDGNALNNDCCTNTCQLLCEVEPNGTIADATAGGSFVAGPVIKGAVSPAGDVDYYPINLLTRTDLRLETFDGTGPGNCVNVDTVMELIAPDGTTVLASNDDVNGANACSFIDPATSPPARGLDPGLYFARITAFSPMNAIPAYTLQLTYVAVCGNGVVEGSEECDGAGGLMCDASCQRVATCGDGFTDGPETCDDANAVNADGCTGCALDLGYQCAGHPSACVPVCGDNLKVGAEACDDGNLAVGDGCDSGCRTEALFVESEANNTPAQADGQPILISAPSTTVSGAIGALGDKDVFKVSIAANTVLRIETFGASGSDCPAAMATTIRLLGPGGAELWADSLNGINNCSALEVYVPVGTYYVQVEEGGNDATIPAYRLQVKLQTAKGNEAEPNGGFLTGTTFAGTDIVIAGSHQALGDADFYAITVAPGRSIRAEILEGDAETCESQGVDSYLELYDALGLLIASDDDGGRSFCSAIDGTGATPYYPTAHALAGGAYYLAVKNTPMAIGAEGQFNYRLALTVR